MATSSPPRLPPPEALATASDETLQAVLDTLFEPSPSLHTLAIPSLRDELSQAPSYAALISHVGTLLASLTTSSSSSSSSSSSPSPAAAAPARSQTLYAILGSHPRLGAKKVTSAQSRAEQAQLNQHHSSSSPSGPEPEPEPDLAALNAEYEARFPGLRYVVFVGGRGRAAVAEDARARIARGDQGAEEREIVAAMLDIARDRAGKLGVLA